MTNGPEFDARVRDFAERALASLTPERRAECELLAQVEPGMRIFPSEQYPEWVELVYGGVAVGLTTWAYLNDGVATPPSDGPDGLYCE
jgi:hypothetical protein